MVKLEKHERIDYLFHPHLQIIQSQQVFTFSLDAILLARFVYVPIQKGKLIDLCSGTGAIPIILSERSKGTITGVEIQPKLHDMAERSIQLNQLDNQIDLICDDIKNMPSRLGHATFDIVTCNPPYFPIDQSNEKNKNKYVAIARHELYTNLREVIDTASQLLKPGGKAAFVHRPERLMDILFYMRTYRIEPKRILFVYPKAGREANILLIEGIKDGKEGIKVLPPLTVYDETGSYTESFRAFCYGS